MPRYQVTLDGKTFIVEGDRPPTETEARTALGEFQASKPKAALPTRPVSAEDFLPEQKSGLENAMDVAKGVGRSVAGAVTGAGKLALDAQKMLMLGNPDAFKEDLRGILGAQGEQLSKAATRAGEGRISEAVGHGAAGLLPLVGPAAAAVGEKAETDPFGAAGEGAGLLLSASPTAMRAAGRGVQATGRGAATAGRAVKPAAIEVGKTLPIEIAAQSLGVPPLVASAARMMLRGVMRGAKKEAPPATAPTPSTNAGGRVVGGTSRPIEAEMSNMLREVSDELGTRPPPAKITTPPPRDLPAGFTPRTTVPKPKPAKMSAPEPKAAEAGPPKRAYFLRPKAETAAASEAAAPTGRSVGIEDLPASWRSRVGTPLGKPGGPQLPSADALEMLQSRGLSAADALDAVAKNPGLTNETRLHLRNALLAMLQ